MNPHAALQHDPCRTDIGLPVEFVLGAAEDDGDDVIARHDEARRPQVGIDQADALP
jgi:hypothetical protein